VAGTVIECESVYLCLCIQPAKKPDKVVAQLLAFELIWGSRDGYPPSNHIITSVLPFSSVSTAASAAGLLFIFLF